MREKELWFSSKKITTAQSNDWQELKAKDRKHPLCQSSATRTDREDLFKYLISKGNHNSNLQSFLIYTVITHA